MLAALPDPRDEALYANPQFVHELRHVLAAR